MPTIAVVSFPGNNCEVESIRAIERNGMKAVSVRWNSDIAALSDIDGYFLVGGFSYEDRGRSGMVAARDPVLEFIGKEADAGKVVIGNCNGAQVLVESGLIPLHDGLQMSLAHNVVDNRMVGFLNEWIWMKPTCAKNRCATADWDTPMHIPIAHGEGRFTTRDKDLLEQLKANDQLAFSYCDEHGVVSQDPVVTPNGSVFAIAGICNPAGNVVAIMPHPERTFVGDPYFASLKNWIEKKSSNSSVHTPQKRVSTTMEIVDHPTSDVEIFIESIITNNEERTVEQALRRAEPSCVLKQLRYLSPKEGSAAQILQNIALFNPNKERAYVREKGIVKLWSSDTKRAEDTTSHPLQTGVSLIRIDEYSAKIQGGESGICYVCNGINEQKLYSKEILEILCNPHASALSRLIL